jgi:hypothetical protein
MLMLKTNTSRPATVVDYGGAGLSSWKLVLPTC